MRKKLSIILFLFPLCSLASESVTLRHSPAFIENKGQIIDQNNKLNPAVLYLLNTPGMNVQLRKGGFSYDLYRSSKIQDPTSNIDSPSGIRYPAPGIQHPASSIQYHRIDLDLLGSNPNCQVVTTSQSSDYLNYYTTGTPTEGVTGVRFYQSVTYKDIYPGIDLEFLSGVDQPFEYNFIIRPGANPSMIRIQIRGPEKIRSFSDGILYRTSIGKVEESIPLCYYKINGISVPVDGRFRKIGDHEFGFITKQTIPEGATLVIDPIPTRRWGTFYGGTPWYTSTSTAENASVIDSEENVIFVGTTSSTDNIATAGAFQGSLSGLSDAFVAKLTPSGQRIWGTFYGGGEEDVGDCCCVDIDGNIIFGGWTNSTDNIATPGAFQTIRHGNKDAMLAKFNTTGQRIWGTYYGGNENNLWGEDVITSCNVDGDGNIFFAGITGAPDYIASPGAHQTAFGGMYDDYLVKFSPDGQRLWGTYYGGTNIEQRACCTFSNSGVIFLSGTTNSSENIATAGSFMPGYNGSTKGFLTAFNSDGQRLWGTYYGGESVADNYGCHIDTGTSVYIFGSTGSLTNIATPGAFQQTQLGIAGNAYLAKFNSSGQRVWGTYYGVNWTYIVGAAVDDSSNLFIVGYTDNQNNVIASPGAFQSVYRGNTDAFLGKFSSAGERFWGTYYGGTSQDQGLCCSVDHNDNVYLCGNTFSDNNSNHDSSLCTRAWSANYIATPGSFISERPGIGDVFLAKFSDCYSPDTAQQIYGPTVVCASTNGVIYSIDPIVAATDYHWCTSNNLTITSGQHTTSITVDVGPVAGTDTISVYGINSCDNGFPKSLLITVLPRPVPVISGTDTICTGDTAVFSTAGGMNGYAWTVSLGGIIISGGTSVDSSVSVIWSAGGLQWVSVGYSNSSCTSLMPTQKSVWIEAGPAVSISITPDANPVCPGSLVTFTATPTNEGSTPLYQWKLNGVNTGSNTPTFTYTPANGDSVRCILTSDVPCASGNPASSNTVILIVAPNLPVTVNISTSLNPVCSGSTVAFTASTQHGGTSPSFQWLVNGIPAGTNDSTFVYVPVNGDLVFCILTSSETFCITNNPDTSNIIVMTVIPTLPVSVTVSASVNPVCDGLPVTFTAAPINGGTNPAYQWRVNGMNVGTNNAVYTYIPASLDLVSCILDSSEPCTSGNPATSNPVSVSVIVAPAVTFTACFDTITTQSAKPIRLKGGIPLGGTYSGPGVNSLTGTFTPSTAGLGAKNITYSYTNTGLCSNSSSSRIHVFTNPIFTCGNPWIDIRDGQSYPTVLIGGQCWFAADLDYGVQIPSSLHQSDNCISEKYFNPASGIQHPASVYQWDELMLYDITPGLQGLCPPGWHVPTENDWNTLFAVYINNGFAASPLKYSGYSGFNALLTGARHLTVQWDYQNFAGFFWSSDRHGPYKAWAHGMNDPDPSVSNYPSLRSNAFSVRCIRD